MVERLNGLDAAMLAGETPEWHMHSGSLMVFEPAPGHGDDFAANLRRVLNARRSELGVFTHRLAEVPLGLGRPVWYDADSEDLGRRVHRVALPAPGGPRELAGLAADLFSTQLNRSGPLWEIWVIEGLHNGQVAMLVKMHHSLIDGVRGARLLEVLYDIQPDAPVVRAHAPAVVGELPPSVAAMAVEAGRFLATTPIRVLRFAAGLVPVAARLGWLFGSSAGRSAALPFRAPRTSMNRALTPERAFAFASVRLEDLRVVKEAFAVTMNDVALAVCADAMRRYLVDRDELPDRSLVAAIPVGVRRDAPARGGNFVSATGTSLHTDVDDPVSRLHAIHDSMASGKKMQQAIGDELVIDALAVLPPAALRMGLGVYRGLRLAEIHPPVFNAIISNVRGPAFPLYSCGAQLVAAYTFGPLLMGCGCNITLVSYRDHVDFGVVTCPDVIAEPWRIADAIPEALSALVRRADAPAGAPVSRSG